MQIETLAKHVRKDIIRFTNTGLADTLGSADIFATLASLENAYPPKDKKIFCSPRLYSTLRTTLAHTGHFSKTHLQKQATPPHENIATAIGRAIALPSEKIYFVMSDEDHNGLAWDAIHFAGNRKTPNIIVVIDRNHIQQGGNTEDISPLEPLRQKYEAFGWTVFETDGHHIPHLLQTIAEAKQTEKPCAIIAHTTPGKGITEIENRHEWTHKQPTELQRKKFVEALQ